MFRLDGDSSIELLSEFELEKDADAPMSMVADPKVDHLTFTNVEAQLITTITDWDVCVWHQ